MSYLIGNSFGQKDIDECIGYIIQDENCTNAVDLDYKDLKVYTITGDSDNNFLMDYDDSIDLMNQPFFWRAIDTKGKDIDMHGCIDDLGYEF